LRSTMCASWSAETSSFMPFPFLAFKCHSSTRPQTKLPDSPQRRFPALPQLRQNLRNHTIQPVSRFGLTHSRFPCPFPGNFQFLHFDFTLSAEPALAAANRRFGPA